MSGSSGKYWLPHLTGGLSQPGAAPYHTGRILLAKYGVTEGLRTLDALQLASALDLKRTGQITVLVAGDQSRVAQGSNCNPAALPFLFRAATDPIPQGLHPDLGKEQKILKSRTAERRALRYTCFAPSPHQVARENDHRRHRKPDTTSIEAARRTAEFLEGETRRYLAASPIVDELAALRSARWPPNAWIVLVPARTSPLCSTHRGMKCSSPVFKGIRFPSMIRV